MLHGIQSPVHLGDTLGSVGEQPKECFNAINFSTLTLRYLRSPSKVA
jgi:hypothetical protein